MSLTGSCKGTQAIACITISAQGKKRIEEFVLKLLRKPRSVLTQGALTDALMVNQAVDYQRAIKEEVKSQQMRDFKTENVQEFLASLAEFEEKLEVRMMANTLWQDLF